MVASGWGWRKRPGSLQGDTIPIGQQIGDVAGHVIGQCSKDDFRKQAVHTKGIIGGTADVRDARSEPHVFGIGNSGFWMDQAQSVGCRRPAPEAYTLLRSGKPVSSQGRMRL